MNDFVQTADLPPSDLPAPIETGHDVTDASAHALEQQREEQARAKTGKPQSIRDSLKAAEKAVNERTRNETLQKVLGKDLADLRPTERKNLMEYLREKTPDISDEEKEARKKVLAELKKMEPKGDKPETSSQGEDRRREAVERAFKAHSGELNKADLSTTEQRQIRADLKARWPDKKLSDVLRYFESWHQKIAADPHNAWQQLAHEYASHTSPQNDRRGKEVGDSKTIGDSLKRANADLSDMADMAEWIKKYGAETPELIRRAEAWDRELRADPYGAAARLAVNMGGLQTPPEQQEPVQQHDPRLVPPRSFDERVSNIQRGLDLFVQHEAPDFDKYAEEVLKIIQSGTLPHGLDNHATVRLAYEKAKAGASGQSAHRQKSISGGAPSSSAPSRGSSKSIRGSLERAMRAV